MCVRCVVGHTLGGVKIRFLLNGVQGFSSFFGEWALKYFSSDWFSARDFAVSAQAIKKLAEFL